MTRRRRGQALVPVLFIVLILTAFAVTLATSSSRQVRAASNAMHEEQMQSIARGAIEYAAMQLQQATADGVTPPQLSQPPDTDANGWTQLGDGWYRVEVIDTASRVNINTATAAELGALPQLKENPALVAAIIDWRDADDTVTQYNGAAGAESETYDALSPAYAAKNAPFDTLDELMLVRGMTSQILYGVPGEDTVNPNPTATSRSSRQSAGTGTAAATAVDTGSTSTLPLVEMLTTYSREANFASDGTARVNILTADAQTLQTTGMTARQAQALITYRGQQTSNIKSVADMMSVTDRGQVVFNRSTMQQLGDKVTVSASPWRENVLNINTAPPEALATIPGVDQTVYNAVVSARNSGTVFTGLNDLFGLTTLNRQQLQALIDRVCTKSSVYIVRVWVRMPGTEAAYVSQALVELGAPQASTTASSSSQGGGSSSSQSSTVTATPAPTVLQYRQVGRRPGWSSWAPAPNYSAGGSVATP